jgi:hypothetical protein
MRFVKALQDSNNKTTILDSIELLPGSANDTGLANNIFKACTTSTKDSSAKIFDFIVANLDSGLIRLNGIANLTVKFTRGSDTTSRYKTYYSYFAYYLATDGNPDSLQRSPELSYAPKRTAVFRYNTAPLWAATDTQRAQIVSAVFQLQRPLDSDTVNVGCCLLDSLYTDGVILDSFFTAAPTVSVPGTDRVLVNLRCRIIHVPPLVRRPCTCI